MSNVSIATAQEMVDTNVLVYAADPDAGERHHRAEALIQRLISGRLLAISVQILNEFYAVATKHHKPPSLSHEKAVQIVRKTAASATVLPLTEAVTLRALDAMPRHGLSFWGALIWASAREHGTLVIHTEDFQHGRTVEGVRFLNPFAADAPPAP